MNGVWEWIWLAGIGLWYAAFIHYRTTQGRLNLTYRIYSNTGSTDRNKIHKRNNKLYKQTDVPRILYTMLVHSQFALSTMGEVD